MALVEPLDTAVVYCMHPVYCWRRIVATGCTPDPAKCVKPSPVLRMPLQNCGVLVWPG